MVDKNEILEYAKEVKEEHPDTSKEEMRKILEAKFVHEEDPLKKASAPTAGAVNNPMDWLRGLRKIFKGASQYVDDDRASGIKKMIDGVLEIIF
jgi:hypothetical protein